MHMNLRHTRASDSLVERYAELSDAARRHGRRNAAGRYLLLSWAAFEDVDIRGFEHAPADGVPSARIFPFARRD